MEQRQNDLKSSLESDFFSDLLTMDELLIFLRQQYSKHTIYHWVQKENMPHVRVKGRLWFPKQGVCHWLKEQSEIKN